jgi:hypothetical protein
MAGLEHAAIDAAAEMLGEDAEDAAVEIGKHEVAVNDEAGGEHDFL